MSYSTIQDYYTLIYTMTLGNNLHKYSLLELERMYPFERDIYMDMLSNQLNQRRQEDGS